jgi:hypothetical protein
MPRVKKLKLAKVALCPRGMNQYAAITLYKMLDEFLGSGDVEPSPPPGEAVPEDVEKVGRAISRARAQQLRAAIDALEQLLAEADGQKGADMADEEATMAKALEDRLAKAEAEVERLTAQLAKAQQSPEDQEAEFLKSLPESVRKRWEADAIEKAALRAALEVEKEKRERSEYIEKTATYRQAGLAPDDWDVLKALDTLDEKPRERVLTLLKALGEQVKTSQLFREVGTRQTGESVGETAAAQLEQLITAEQAKGADVPYTKAFQAVAKAHPALYEAYTREMQGRTKV